MAIPNNTTYWFAVWLVNDYSQIEKLKAQILKKLEGFVDEPQGNMEIAAYVVRRHCNNSMEASRAPVFVRPDETWHDLDWNYIAIECLAAWTDRAIPE